MRDSAKGFIVGVIAVLLLLLFLGAARGTNGRYQHHNATQGTMGSITSVLDTQSGHIYLYWWDSHVWVKVDMIGSKILASGNMERMKPEPPPGFVPVD